MMLVLVGPALHGGWAVAGGSQCNQHAAGPAYLRLPVYWTQGAGGKILKSMPIRPALS